MVSPRRVVSRYLSASGVRISPNAKKATNAALIRAGMDGNGRFASPAHALSVAGKILEVNSMEIDETVHGAWMANPQGRVNLSIGATTPEGVASITNSALAIQWYRLDGGAFEVVAYLS